ncbi:uncharacterized protein CTHT_0068510 [Thermochaetoides thermophila DSM 1495]|uniref:Methyltransferase domain-containing protein n=1 Tax=Chaetomium thermophilum (strain DSM 1495 / CBS 144.50 / IMI 039719) TaxID=759272 RepID=G0SH32_CHATD|nr:hypothetical protein CTHT_0068510 [Thermochaetoides thermophila DSM 1495]EGS17521.1 hypothetical protein CTHT_0068510 [Thermochaetoides thermophila DSM 1495]
MEFMAGYAAAKAPYSTYQVEPASQSHRSNINKPTRSNSTSGTHKKRSRIPGHARTNSASTSGSGSGSGSGPGARNDRDDVSGVRTDPVTSATNLLSPVSAGAAGAPTGRLSAEHQRLNQQQQHHHLPLPHHHNNTLVRRASARDRDRDHDRDRDRDRASSKHHQDKHLPATPRLNNQDAAPSISLGPATAAFEPSSLRAAGPVSISLTSPGSAKHSATMLTDMMMGTRAAVGAGSMPRADSVSSVSGTTTTSNRTVFLGDHGVGPELVQRPFVVRNGRTYIADPTLPYPLPVDLEELHRQSLKTMLLMQLFGRPICSPGFANNPPSRVLDVGCGTGFWSMMCYRHYEARGQAADMSFTGIDIVPLCPSGPVAAGTDSGNSNPQVAPVQGMNWRFVQHDLRKLPLPFPDASFDFVMVKDMSLATTTGTMQQSLIEEYIRVLAPGGSLEIWETDHLLRMLRPHIPEPATTVIPQPTDQKQQQQSSDSNHHNSDDSPPDGDDPSHHETFSPTDVGAYLMTSKTPLSTPLNNFLVEYNAWVTRALEARQLPVMPCTLMSPLLLQEAEALTGIGSRRLAVPLSEIRWEREGVGGVVTKDGKSYIDSTGAGSKGKYTAKDGNPSGGVLQPAAAALRRAALVTVVQQIQSLEPVLREVSGKSQDEWDTWIGKMMGDLVRENGTNWGECLEVGVWWARKR